MTKLSAAQSKLLAAIARGDDVRSLEYMGRFRPSPTVEVTPVVDGKKVYEETWNARPTTLNKLRELGLVTTTYQMGRGESTVQITDAGREAA